MHPQSPYRQLGYTSRKESPLVDINLNGEERRA